MNILVLGAGGAGRQDAICWALKEKMGADDQLYAAPGNPGTSRWATNLEVDALDNAAVLKLVRDYEINLVVVGPEAPLENGVVDYLNKHAPDVLVFGPTQAAARLETEKDFAIEVMAAAKVPHPYSQTFDNPLSVTAFARDYCKHGKGLVVKARGLTGGKDVFICANAKEADAAAQLCWARHPGEPIVVQELLIGQEVSVFAFIGENVSDVVAACDYKRVGKNNTGPNTGGMGAYTPPKFWTRKLAEYVRQWIFLPIVREMQRNKTPYRGILYAGLMILPDGTVKVLEFNCRLGDPEAQVILPCFKGNIIDVMVCCAKGWLPANAVAWRKNMAVCGVVLASEGYPGHEQTGRIVSGINEAEHTGCVVFHGATKKTTEGIVTTGGRVLTVVGIGASSKRAREQAYAGCSRIRLKGGHMRPDIADV